ncbi:uncharacterized protein H6S33_011959 [Morchella sextelata]|uniref:uncharacterized protein n=1 Tax=Morchella sextelata TaxID=1174677 RepID=UPI001D04E87B|nr:uncharacterized protein H6S33_011959 [Morchella sextelata]KAH0610432.1 hypothetical protein H6S33_011959 [Morchella sextelata]
MKPTDLLTYLCLLLLTFLLSHPILSHPTAIAIANPLPRDIHTRGHYTCKKMSIRGPLRASTRALALQLSSRHNEHCTQDQRFAPKCTVLASDGDEARIAICGYPKGWILCSWVVFAALEIAAGCVVPTTERATGEFVFDGKPGMRVVVYKAGREP